MAQDLSGLAAHAQTLFQQGRHREAISALTALLAVSPADADGWYNLGYILRKEGRFEEALAAYSRSLEAGVAMPEEVHLNRAAILSDHLRREAEAEKALRTALELNPDYAPALLNLGNLLEEQGKKEEAIACYEKLRARRDEPDTRMLACEALARLAHLAPPTDSADSLLEQMEHAAATAPDGEARANLLYALGRSWDALGEPDNAFGYIHSANRVAAIGYPPYDRLATERLVNAIIAAFPGSPDSKDPPSSLGRERPIFICGMFRSGSSLTEQLLASHPSVTAGGELDYFSRLVRGPLAPFPASVARLSRKDIQRIRDDYLAWIGRLFPGPAGADAAFVTDKRPDNYMLIGLIKRAFPSARIIHTVRNPLDNGLSIYMQHLSPLVAPYSVGLSDIGHYFGQYQKLMGHWKSLYGPSILDFDYDALVKTPQASLASLLEFLALPWHEGCLDFHELRNPVKTASYWQVRQPLYSKASGRWKRYSAHLGPLMEALRQAGLRPEGAEHVD